MRHGSLLDKVLHDDPLQIYSASSSLKGRAQVLSVIPLNRQEKNGRSISLFCARLLYTRGFRGVLRKKTFSLRFKETLIQGLLSREVFLAQVSSATVERAVRMRIDSIKFSRQGKESRKQRRKGLRNQVRRKANVGHRAKFSPRLAEPRIWVSLRAFMNLPLTYNAVSEQLGYVAARFRVEKTFPLRVYSWYFLHGPDLKLLEIMV